MVFLYDTATGALLSVLPRLPEPGFTPPNGQSMRIREDLQLIDANWSWDPVAKDAVRLKTRPVFSKLEFTRKFTMIENIAITQVRLDPTTPLSVRAQLETLKDYLERATLVDVRDADTIAGVEAAVDVLISVGVLLPEDRETRIAQILEYGEAS